MATGQTIYKSPAPITQFAAASQHIIGIISYQHIFFSKIGCKITTFFLIARYC